MSILTADRLRFAYRTKYQTIYAVDDVSCTLLSGKFHVLIGKSGSGKTTLLSLFAGLERPQSGTVQIDGRNLCDIDLDAYRRSEASIIYQSYNLFPLMTVLENIMFPLLLLKQTKAEAKMNSKAALSSVGLDETYCKRFPSMLSGGEQQRVAIARALAVHARIILADEPTGNLDSENSQQIIDQLQRLAHEENCCVLVVTHDTEIAKQADVVFRMDSGHLSEVSV